MYKQLVNNVKKQSDKTYKTLTAQIFVYPKCTVDGTFP